MTRAAIGIDIGGTGAKGALVDSDGSVQGRRERPTDPTAGTKTILGLLEEMIDDARRAGAAPVAIGIGAAGFIDAASGSVVFSPNLTYEDPQLREAVGARFDLPVVVDNDANAAAWGERRFGSAQGFDHVALITLGTGIGSGFVSDGRLIRGATGAGAEFGHTVIDPQGPPCPCGLRGCLEQFASGTAIERMAKEAVAREPGSLVIELAGTVEAITAREVGRAAPHDESARAVLRKAGRALGIGLSNVVNVFDPQVIVLGGGVIGAGEAFLGPARDELHRSTTAQRRRPVRLVLSALGGDAGLVGAAALALDANPADAA